jgi:hypothetical protein
MRRIARRFTGSRAAPRSMLNSDGRSTRGRRAIIELQPTRSVLNAPLPHVWRPKSCGPTVMTAADSDGGGSSRIAHWVYPRYEAPTVANEPVNQGCFVSHATVSWPSSRSVRIGSKPPSEAPVPRQLTNSTW